MTEHTSKKPQCFEHNTEQCCHQKAPTMTFLRILKAAQAHSDELKPVYSGPDDDDHTLLVAIWHGIDSTLHILVVSPA